MKKTNLTLKKGDTHYLEVVVTRKDQAGVEQPVNLAGCNLWFTAKNKIGDLDDDAFIRKGTPGTTLTGIDITSAPDGEALITLVPADTITAATGTKVLFWDLQLEETDNTITTVNGGRLALSDQITISS